jgi:hypothetical protein
MKKLFGFLLITFLVALLVACGDTSTDDINNNTLPLIGRWEPVEFTVRPALIMAEWKAELEEWRISGDISQAEFEEELAELEKWLEEDMIWIEEDAAEFFYSLIEIQFFADGIVIIDVFDRHGRYQEKFYWKTNRGTLVLFENWFDDYNYVISNSSYHISGSRLTIHNFGQIADVIFERVY